MRIARLRLQRFRGYEAAEFVLAGHVVFGGEPRAGRSDLIRALFRVLDPRSTRGRVDPLDIHRPAPGDRVALTEVEVVLLELGPELEQLLHDNLEAFDSETGELADRGAASTSVLGIRLCYRARYDPESDTGDHWVDLPVRSEPAAEVFRRISRADREALPVLFIHESPPLQVRAEGGFRTLIERGDQSGLESALSVLAGQVHDATSSFSQSDVVSKALTAVLKGGAGELLGLDRPGAVEFVPEDGTLAGLLRALQPAVALDDAGPLPARSHGSTAEAILAVAEAVASAAASGGELVIIGDDFGDGLDGAGAEHLAYLLRRASKQCILTTRRPEVLRAFPAEEFVRLTRSHGSRQQHRLQPTDKKGRANRRIALDQLLGAMTTRTVVLLEGPLDAEGYGALASRLAIVTGDQAHSLPAHGIRFVAPPGSDGGISRLAGIANLAKDLGFHVRAVVDSDKPGSSDHEIADLIAITEQVVVLPRRTAVEAALIRGLPADELRSMVSALADLGHPPIPDHVSDGELADHLIASKALKQQGLHVAWVYALDQQPPIARKVIEELCGPNMGRVDIADVS